MPGDGAGLLEIEAMGQGGYRLLRVDRSGLGVMRVG